jgi:branched-chain amino acid aminotransferase
MIRTRLLTSTVRGRAFISHVPASFQTARIQTHLTTQPKAIPPNDTLVFGRTFSDHMFLADWDVEGGWSGERIVPYGKIALEPSAAVFHYAFEVRIDLLRDGSRRLKA